MKTANMPEWGSLSATNPILASIPKQLQVVAHLIEASAGETLARIGQRPRSMLYVLSGEVRLIRRSRRGGDIVLQRSQSGFIAEASLESLKYHCNIIAAASSRLLRFPIPAFSAALESEYDFRKAWVSLLAKEIQKLRVQCERLSLKSARERILHYLKAEGTNGEIKLRVSRKAWAAELGLTHEALYRSLAQLKREGVITLNVASIRLQP
jgi:CRP/FNR family transcriptional regulator, dissimilatory nitrate respiration regulator